MFLFNRRIATRIAVSRLRLSNHELMIEKGRHLKLDVNQRICPFCEFTKILDLHLRDF